MHRQAKGHDELRARAPGAAVSCGCGEEGIDLLQRLLQRVRSPRSPLFGALDSSQQGRWSERRVWQVCCPSNISNA